MSYVINEWKRCDVWLDREARRIWLQVYILVGPSLENFLSGIDHHGQVPDWEHERLPYPRESIKFPEHPRVVDRAPRLHSAGVHRHLDLRLMQSVLLDRVIPPVSPYVPPVSPRKSETKSKYTQDLTRQHTAHIYRGKVPSWSKSKSSLVCLSSNMNVVIIVIVCIVFILLYFKIILFSIIYFISFLFFYNYYLLFCYLLFIYTHIKNKRYT